MHYLKWSRKKQSAGFTLIELLVVISIIGVLAGLVLVSMNGARAKARDARKMDDLRNISMAFQIFYANNSRMPLNYNPCCGACEGGTYYDQSMQELVNAKLISSIPHSPGGGVYCYYDYGSGNSVGAILVTTLEAAPISTAGVNGSCRPWGAGQNWCDQSNNSYYCICGIY